MVLCGMVSSEYYRVIIHFIFFFIFIYLLEVYIM